MLCGRGSASLPVSERCNSRPLIGSLFLFDLLRHFRMRFSGDGIPDQQGQADDEHDGGDGLKNKRIPSKALEVCSTLGTSSEEFERPTADGDAKRTGELAKESPHSSSRVPSRRSPVFSWSYSTTSGIMLHGKTHCPEKPIPATMAVHRSKGWSVRVEGGGHRQAGDE